MYDLENRLSLQSPLHRVFFGTGTALKAVIKSLVIWSPRCKSIVESTNHREATQLEQTNGRYFGVQCQERECIHVSASLLDENQINALMRL